MISVIVPTYKRACIWNCINALVNQKEAPEYEIIIAARDMPEYTKTQLKLSFPNKLTFVDCPFPGNGPAKNKAAFCYAYGTFLAFTDDDCIPDEYWLHELNKAQLVRNADIVIGDCLAGIPYNKYLYAHQTHIRYYLYRLTDTNDASRYPHTKCGTTMNMLIRKTTFCMLGGFNPRFAKHFGDDRWFNVLWADSPYAEKIDAVWNPEAKVYHEHNFTFRSFIKTSFRYGMGIKQCQDLAKIFKYKPIPAPPSRSEYINLVEYADIMGIPGFSMLMMIMSQELKRLGILYATLFPKAISKVN